MPGHLIAVAEFEGNKTRYLPVSQQQQNDEKRAKGRMRRLQGHMDEVEQELRSTMLEYQPVQPVIEIAPVPAPVREPTYLEQVHPAPEPNARPVFRTDIEFARWLIANPDAATASQREYANELLSGPSTRELLRTSGVDLVALRSIARSAA